MTELILPTTLGSWVDYYPYFAGGDTFMEHLT